MIEMEANIVSEVETGNKLLLFHGLKCVLRQITGLLCLLCCSYFLSGHADRLGRAFSRII